MTQRFKNLLFLFMLIMAIFCSARAGEELNRALTEEPEFKPILNHILSPREATDLSGIWQTASTELTSSTPPPQSAWAPVVVPGDHKDLFSKAKGRAIWFRRTLNLQSPVAGHVYRLCIEQATDVSEVYVNGQFILQNDLWSLPFEADITSALKEGENTIDVKVLPLANDGKDRVLSFSWFHAGFRGIPLPVHLEQSADIYVSDVRIITDVTPEKVLHVQCTVTNSSGNNRSVSVGANIIDGITLDSKNLTLEAGTSGQVTWSMNWQDVKLWNPDTPTLYNLDITVSQNKQALDSYRQRFGFRELKARNGKLYFNDRQYLCRRISDIAYRSRWGKFAPYLQSLKKQGYNGLRSDIVGLKRWAFVADEEGFILTPAGFGGYVHADQVNDVFYDNWKKQFKQTVRYFKNHPSIGFWVLSIEFGDIYCRSKDPEVVKKGILRSAEVGRYVQELDPTRLWSCDGESDLRGLAPVYSGHYRYRPTNKNCELPEGSYLYSRKERQKPLMLSEDLYPVYTFTPPYGMSTWAGDNVYTIDGYFKAWFDGLRMIAEGYYYNGGVSLWNPWDMELRTENFPLHKFGQAMPDWLIALREHHVNLRGGEIMQKTLLVYNQTFTDYTGKITVHAKIKGSEIAQLQKDVAIEAGACYSEVLELDLPAIDAESDFTLTVNLEGKAERDFEFNLYPQTQKITLPQGTIVYALDDSFWTDHFPSQTFSDFNELIKLSAKRIIVARELNSREGRYFSQLVKNGTPVLTLVDKGWLPMPIEVNVPKTMCWKRDEQSLKGISDRDLRLWHPDEYMGSSSYRKSGNRSISVLVDSATSDGISRADVLRLYEGKGYWLLCSLPILERLDADPGAKNLLQALISELANPIDVPQKNIYIAQNSQLLKDMLLAFDIPYKESDDQSEVMLVDGNAKINEAYQNEIMRFCNAGGTAIMIDASDINSELIRKLGLQLSPSEATEVTLIHRDGIMRGISNDDLFWRQKNDFHYYIKAIGKGLSPKKSDNIPMLGAALSALPDSKAEIMTNPGAIAEVSAGRGKVIVTTLRWDQFSTVKPRRSALSLRALLTNCGAITSSDNIIPEYRPLDISMVMNRGFWNQPDLKELPEGWFGGDNDMRYFPVNRPGFDPVLNMDQPVEPFPTELCNYGGIYFKLVDPAKNKGAACLVLETGKSVRISLTPVKTEKIWMLGALEKHQQTGTDSIKVTFEYADGCSKVEKIIAGVHVNGYRWYSDLKEGVIGWTGSTPKDRGAVLACWSLRNSSAKKAITNIVLENIGKTNFALISVTAENHQNGESVLQKTKEKMPK